MRERREEGWWEVESRRRWRRVHTHLEGNGVYMREGHCLHESGSAEK